MKIFIIDDKSLNSLIDHFLIGISFFEHMVNVYSFTGFTEASFIRATTELHS